jgi:hypothetical protein
LAWSVHGHYATAKQGIDAGGDRAEDYTVEKVVDIQFMDIQGNAVVPGKTETNKLRKELQELHHQVMEH